jgi:acetyl esterase/lipase/outer membrane protein assembly factor BamB
MRQCITQSILVLFMLGAPSADAARITKTMTYKTVGSRELQMHIHFPEDWQATDARPVMVFFFGGGWTGGTVDQFLPQADYFAARGLVAARADYRVKNRDGVTPDQCVEDARSAVRWLRQHAGELGIDPMKLISSGGSAGGHLAASTMISESVESPEDDVSISTLPQAMVLFNPVLSFEPEALIKRLGDRQHLARRISPTAHLSKQSPPALILFGTEDRLKAFGDAYWEKAADLGVRADKFMAQGQGHGFFNRSPWLEQTIAAADRFLASLGFLQGEPIVEQFTLAKPKGDRAVKAKRSALAGNPVRDLSKHLARTSALVVLVCAGEERDLAMTVQIVEQTPWTVFCRGPVSSGMDRVRSWAREQGLLGERVYVADEDSTSLWLASDMADAVWVAPSVKNPPSEKEMLRSLRPGAVCVVTGRTFTKPAPAGVDEWRHPYHGPNNNVVSQDGVARLPGELRFQTYPTFAPMPNQTLFAGGRIFFFSGHIAFHEREEGLLNTLTVLNAYNGLSLWSRALDPDCVVHNLVKLATPKELVFAEGPTLWMLDAATGAQRGKFHVPNAIAATGDTDWKWLAQEGDRLWVALGPPDARVAAHRRRGQMGHWPWNVANEQYKTIVNNFGAARTLAAYRYPEMKLLWHVTEPEPFDARTLCMEGRRVFALAPQRYMTARNADTGKPIWRSTPKTSPKLFDAVGNPIKRQGWGLGWATYTWVRAHGNVICIAGPPFSKTIAVGLDKGDLLWTADIPSPHPFFVDDDLYVMPRVGSDTICRKINPITGKVLDQFNLGVIGSCTRLTVSPNQFFFRPGGGEGRTVYVDMGSRKLADYEGIVRPGCFDGVVPAHGRLYWMPLACDCWQVHGTFSMAPRVPLKMTDAPTQTSAWAAPETTAPASQNDWPMFRADPAGTATVPVAIGKNGRELWRMHLPGEGLSAPVCVGGRIFVGGRDGTVRALDAANGDILWQSACQGAVLYPPAYWKGRVVFGSCDGMLYCVDAANGRSLGRSELARERRFVNIMDQFMSAWPLGGGVVLSDEGIAYTAAGSTAADGTIAAAVDVATGDFRWHQAYTLDRPKPELSFGVQGNILLKNNTLFVNGGAPVGIVALDALTGANARVASKLEAGMDMFLEPDNKPACSGPELFSYGRTRTTIFKRHQGRMYFQTADRNIALIDGRIFCAANQQSLDRIVDLMNKDPKTGGKMGGLTVPWDVMRIPIPKDILWASKRADLLGLAVGSDGLVVLHSDSVEGIAIDGTSQWTVPLPAAPVRWGLALTGKECIITLSDGNVVCVRRDS